MIQFPRDTIVFVEFPTPNGPLILQASQIIACQPSIDSGGQLILGQTLIAIAGGGMAKVPHGTQAVANLLREAAAEADRSY
jgi:ribulose 1,5-bisphosphate carboxylase large subunit-like protein